jgi:mannitol/fructose-specific phosphotransferase system IIA component (Ntr-type)
MNLAEHISVDHIKIPLESGDKVGAITELVDLLNGQGRISQRDVVLKAVLDREGQRSTGLGKGFALPHAKSEAIDRLLIAFGRPKAPIPFESSDNQPVDLIALLLSPVSATVEHITALAQLNRLALNTKLREQLAQVPTAGEFLHLICESTSSR